MHICCIQVAICIYAVECNIAQQGTLVEPQQDTPVSTKHREVAYVPFDVDVELSTPLEEIPQGDQDPQRPDAHIHALHDHTSY